MWESQEANLEGPDRFWKAREAMVHKQIQQRGIHDPRLLDVMRRLPRHWFVPPALRAQAYEDRPLSIGRGQTISQPYMVATMTDLLALNGSETVLEIGTGSGYQAAVLGEMAKIVHTIERHEALAQRARMVLDELGMVNVYVHIGDGTYGWPSGAPYQAILVTAAAPEIPEPLINQLDENGRLVIPVGGREKQFLERWRLINGQFYREAFFSVAFVPLRGRYGWEESEWEENTPPESDFLGG